MLLQPEPVTLLFLIIAGTWAAVSDKESSSRGDIGLHSAIDGKKEYKLLSTVRPVRFGVISRDVPSTPPVIEISTAATMTTAKPKDKKPKVKESDSFNQKLTASVQVLLPRHEEDATTTEIPWHLLDVDIEDWSPFPSISKKSQKKEKIQAVTTTWNVRKPGSYLKRPFGPGSKNKSHQPVVKTDLYLPPGYSPILATAAPPTSYQAHQTKIVPIVSPLENIPPFQRNSILLASLPTRTNSVLKQASAIQAQKDLLTAYVISRPTTTATSTTTTTSTTARVPTKDTTLDDTLNMESVVTAASTMLADSLSFVLRFVKTVYRQMDSEVRLAALAVVLVPLGLITLFTALQPQQSFALAGLFLFVPMVGYLLLTTSTSRSAIKRSKKQTGSDSVEARYFQPSLENILRNIERIETIVSLRE